MAHSLRPIPGCEVAGHASCLSARPARIACVQNVQNKRGTDRTWPVRAGTRSRLRSLRLHGADGRSSSASQILPEIRSQLGSREPTLGHLPPSLAPHSLSLSPRNRGCLFLLRLAEGAAQALPSRFVSARPPRPPRSAAPLAHVRVHACAHRFAVAAHSARTAPTACVPRCCDA